MDNGIRLEMIGLSLTVFELWPFEIWAQIREKREIPCHPATLSPAFLPRMGRRYIYKFRSGCVQSARRHWCVKSSACVTVRKLWTAISRVIGDVVATRSSRQISTQSSHNSSRINSFNVQREILFVNVIIIDSSSCEVLGQRCARTSVY